MPDFPRPVPGADVPLQVFFEARLTALADVVRVQNENAQGALTLAREIADGQREASNYVRDQLREQAATFPTRELLDSRVNEIHQRLDRLVDRSVALEKQAANLQGRIWALGVGLTVFFGVAQLLLRLVR